MIFSHFLPKSGSEMPLNLGLSKLQKDSFLRSVSVLVGGTAFAQAVTVMALPLLTRLYTPADFSVLAVYVSLLGMGSVAACLRLDIAIPLPDSDKDAANLLALALFFGTIVTVIAAFLVFLIPVKITTLLEQPALSPYLWVIPIGIFFSSSYSALQFWSTRKKAFAVVARSRMSQSIGGVGTQAAMGWVGIAPFGLLLGQMINSGAGIIGLARRALKFERDALSSINTGDMWRLFREYERFPKYSTFEALANSAGIQLPILIIATLAIGPEAGFLILAMRVMQAPMALVGSAVGQVYLSRAAEEYRAGNLGFFTADTLGGLIKVGVGPLIFIAILAPQVFGKIFGEEWSRAGILVSWMVPWFIMQFLVSPISMGLHVTNNQKAAMILQFFGLALRSGFVLIAGRYLPSHLAEVYAITGFMFYLTYFIMVGNLTGLKWKPFFYRSVSSAPIILAWIVLSVLILFALWLVQ